MTRRFIRNSNPNIKQLVEEEQCGCGNRMLPYLMKSAVDPCVEERVTGQIITDQGFETTASIPQGYTGEPVGWVSGAFGNGNWILSTANPRSGVDHARFNYDSGTIIDTLDWIRGYSCSDTARLVMTDFASYAAIVSPGDVINFSVWHYFNLGTSNRVDLGRTFYRANGTQVTNDLTIMTGIGNGSYTQASTTFVIPAESHYMHVYCESVFDSGATIGNYLDIDDVSLTVT